MRFLTCVSSSTFVKNSCFKTSSPSSSTSDCSDSSSCVASFNSESVSESESESECKARPVGESTSADGMTSSCAPDIVDLIIVAGVSRLESDRKEGSLPPKDVITLVESNSPTKVTIPKNKNTRCAFILQAEDCRPLPPRRAELEDPKSPPWRPGAVVCREYISHPKTARLSAD